MCSLISKSGDDSNKYLFCNAKDIFLPTFISYAASWRRGRLHRIYTKNPVHLKKHAWFLPFRRLNRWIQWTNKLECSFSIKRTRPSDITMKSYARNILPECNSRGTHAWGLLVSSHTGTQEDFVVRNFIRGTNGIRIHDIDSSVSFLWYQTYFIQTGRQSDRKHSQADKQALTHAFPRSLFVSAWGHVSLPISSIPNWQNISAKLFEQHPSIHWKGIFA